MKVILNKLANSQYGYFVFNVQHDCSPQYSACQLQFVDTQISTYLYKVSHPNYSSSVKITAVPNLYRRMAHLYLCFWWNPTSSPTKTFSSGTWNSRHNTALWLPEFQIRRDFFSFGKITLCAKCLYGGKLSRCGKGIQSEGVGEWRTRRDSCSEKISLLKTS